MAIYKSIFLLIYAVLLNIPIAFSETHVAVQGVEESYVSEINMGVVPTSFWKSFAGFIKERRGNFFIDAGSLFNLVELSSEGNPGSQGYTVWFKSRDGFIVKGNSRVYLRENPQKMLLMLNKVSFDIDLICVTESVLFSSFGQGQYVQIMDRRGSSSEPGRSRSLYFPSFAQFEITPSGCVKEVSFQAVGLNSN